MKYTYDDYLEGNCTKAQYRAQFNPPTIKVGAIYTQAPGTWHEQHYKILYIDGGVAFAKSTYNANGGFKYIGDYEMFNVDDGWRYNDSRENYRLVREVLK